MRGMVNSSLKIGQRNLKIIIKIDDLMSNQACFFDYRADLAGAGSRNQSQLYTDYFYVSVAVCRIWMRLLRLLACFR